MSYLLYKTSMLNTTYMTCLHTAHLCIICYGYSDIFVTTVVLCITRMLCIIVACVQKQNNNGTPIKTKEDGENCKQ